jgi:DNA primase
MSSNNVEKIKERLSIVDVISSYLTLIPAGRNYKAKCPFHNEKTPSFFVSAERNSYYCFGCGAKGDIFSFVEHFEGTDFLGALKLLAQRAGITLENNFSRENKDEKEIFYQIMEEATIFFETIFTQESAPRAYLKNRGIDDKTMKSFRIGFAQDSWKSVSTHLINKGFKKGDIEKVGLIKNKDDGSFYDRFRSRIIFPINDSSGRVIAFSGRIFGKEDDKEAKYLNSPETPLFNKSNTLFGIDKAKIAIKKRGYSIVVEGQMDLILSHQADFTNTVAVSGTALSDRTSERDSYSNPEDNQTEGEAKINNLGLIRRLSPNVIFAFDGDSAGIRAVSRSSLIALSLDMQVKVAIMPEGQDPADIILKDPNTWKEIIKNSVDIISFHLNRICQNTDDLHQRGKQIREIIFPFLTMIKSSIEKSTYISLIYKKTGISENAIIEDFENYEKAKVLENHLIGDQPKRLEIKSRRERLEERLSGIIFWKGESNDNQSKEIKKLCDSFEKEIGQGNFEKMKEKHRPNSSVLAFEAEIWYGDKINQITCDIKEIILNLEEEILNERLTYLLNEISQKENKEKKEEVNLLLKDYQEIVERIENIKKDRTQ